MKALNSVKYGESGNPRNENATKERNTQDVALIVKLIQL